MTVLTVKNGDAAVSACERPLAFPSILCNAGGKGLGTRGFFADNTSRGFVCQTLSPRVIQNTL